MGIFSRWYIYNIFFLFFKEIRLWYFIQIYITGKIILEKKILKAVCWKFYQKCQALKQSRLFIKIFSLQSFEVVFFPKCPGGRAQYYTTLQCAVPFIIILPSSSYNLDNNERDEKHQLRFLFCFVYHMTSCSNARTVVTCSCFPFMLLFYYYYYYVWSFFVLYVCLCWGFTAQSTQWCHVERSHFT